ncbi:hypothetical protein CC2G_003657 [Coprinopsis cinerea AmutBmut pab1-1]|nr:hypothetical protein CC2G_003657 [Coprinopsis cinerea AmutBmut pab1-1]
MYYLNERSSCGFIHLVFLPFCPTTISSIPVRDWAQLDAADPAMSAVSSLSADEYARTAFNLRVAKSYSLASCVMLFYDIMLTFGEEVETIWKQPRWSHMTLLFALNRYLTPLGYIVIIVSFHQPWSTSVCDRYILFPEALKIVTATVIGIVFVLRVHAIYGRNMVATTLASMLLITELAVKIWAFTDGTRLQLPEGLVGCILVGKQHTRFAFTWIAELGFDSAIFLMTLWGTFSYYRVQRGNPESLYALVVRDGIVYFAIICGANVITVSFFLAGAPDIKAINASFSTLITSLMVSRLILNLRTAGGRTHVSHVSTVGRRAHAPSRIQFETGTVGKDTIIDCDELRDLTLTRYELARIKSPSRSRVFRS